jgi:hypothetical protein
LNRNSVIKTGEIYGIDLVHNHYLKLKFLH